ncbi:hypothetical protein AgCh_022428 [Apium graveolens]
MGTPSSMNQQNEKSITKQLGRSLVGRPGNALVYFGSGRKLIMMKDNNSPLRTSIYGGQELAKFMDFINYSEKIDLARLNKKYMRREWSLVFDFIIRAFTCRKTIYDNISSVVQKLVYSMAYNKHLDVGSLILEELSTRLTMHVVNVSLKITDFMLEKFRTYPYPMPDMRSSAMPRLANITQQLLTTDMSNQDYQEILLSYKEDVEEQHEKIADEADGNVDDWLSKEFTTTISRFRDVFTRLDRGIKQGAKEIRKKTVLAHRNEEEAYFLVILYFVVTLDASFLCFEPIYSCDQAFIQTRSRTRKRTLDTAEETNEVLDIPEKIDFEDSDSGSEQKEPVIMGDCIVPADPALMDFSRPKIDDI